MKILLIEDNVELRGLLCEHLEQRGFVVDAVGSGADAGTALGQTAYDAVVLDLGLPDMDGMQLLEKLRKGHGDTPVLILSARGQLHDRLRGLDGGADDYLVKPFDLQEVEARLRAVLRRPGARQASTLVRGNIHLDTNQRSAEVGGSPVELSRREWVLLKALVEAGERVMVKDVLEERLYAFDEAVTPNALEAVVSRLRRKLLAAGSEHTVESRRGIGYCLRPVSRP